MNFQHVQTSPNQPTPYHIKQPSVPTQYTKDIMNKVMSMMRYQIYISSTFYMDKTKSMLKYQARYMEGLRGIIRGNYMYLQKKSCLIDALKQQIEKENPKRKINLYSSNPYQNYHMSQLNTKIKQMYYRQIYLQNQITQITVIQNQLNSKIYSVYKGMLKYLGAKISVSLAKFNDFAIKKEYYVYKKLTSFKESMAKSEQAHMGNKGPLVKLGRDVGELREYVYRLRGKYFRYDNCQLEYVRKLLTHLGHKITNIYTQNASQPVSLTRVSSTKTIPTPTLVHTFSHPQIPDHPSRFPHHSQQLTSPVSPFTSSKLTHTTTLTHTPKYINCFGYQYYLYRSTNTMKPVHKLSKTVSYNRYGNDLYRNNSNVQVTNRERNEWKYYDNASDINQYQYESDESYYSSNYSEYLQTIQYRLIQTIQQMNLTLPVKVYIDQTGYLKCITNSMYFVDTNNDAFYLDYSYLDELIQSGIVTL